MAGCQEQWPSYDRQRGRDCRLNSVWRVPPVNLCWRRRRLGRRRCSLVRLALLDFETSIVGIICSPGGLLMKCFAQLCVSPFIK